MNTVNTSPNLSEVEKEKLLRELLGNDYQTSGNNLPVLKKAIDVIGHTSDAASFAELIPLLNSAMMNIRILSVISSGASVLSVVLFPISTMIDIINAYQVGIKMYSYRAIAYTITAWAFSKPIPKSSQRIILNSQTRFPVASREQIQEKHSAWLKASQSATKELENYLNQNRIKKEVFQLLLRSLADNNEQKLCELFLKGFEKHFSDFHTKNVWRSNYSIRFPN